MMAASLFGLISILVYLGIIVFIIYVALTILKLMKQKNEYLKDKTRKVITSIIEIHNFETVFNSL